MQNGTPRGASQKHEVQEPNRDIQPPHLPVGPVEVPIVVGNLAGGTKLHPVVE